MDQDQKKKSETITVVINNTNNITKVKITTYIIIILLHIARWHVDTNEYCIQQKGIIIFFQKPIGWSKK